MMIMKMMMMNNKIKKLIWFKLLKNKFKKNKMKLLNNN